MKKRKRNKLSRLLWFLTLNREDKIVHNFRTMTDIVPYNTIRRDGVVFEFEKALQELPNSFIYIEKPIDIHAFLKETWTTGFLVIKDDQIRFEQYYLGNKEDTLSISWSAGKSIVSALIGIAISEKSIDGISSIVSDIVPELKGSGYEGVALKDVLQMSSGIAFDEDYRNFFSDINRLGRTVALGRSINAFVCKLKSERTPGTYNHYVSMDTQVLGMVLKQATGKSPSEYLEEKIWGKLGMESDARWLIDDTGMELVFGTLNATVRDYARFGRLYAKYGNWEGEEIVPKMWVLDSITPDAPHLMPGKNALSDFTPGYGYHWWLPEEPEGDFFAIGIRGQYIYINPNQNVIVVKMSADPYWAAGSEKDAVTRRLCQYIANNLD